MSQNYKTRPPELWQHHFTMTKTLIFTALFTVFAVSVAFAQGADTAAMKAEMKKLDNGVGKWEGSGWMLHGKEKSFFTGTEHVQKKLDGLNLLVEGRFTAKGAPDQVVHQTLAVISFDNAEKAYKFRTYLLNGASGNHNIKLIDGGWEWGFDLKDNAGKIRYTIKLNADTWHETGEFSKDGGKTWMQTFEMTLKKVG